MPKPSNPQIKSIAFTAMTQNRDMVNFKDYMDFLRQISDVSNDLYMLTTRVTPYYTKITGPIVYQIQQLDFFIACDATNGNVVYQLPPAANKRMIIFKRIDSTANTVTITRYGSDTIDSGTSSITVTSAGFIMLTSDGFNNWMTISSNNPNIGPNQITNTMLAQMPANTIKGNNTGGTANALDLTVAQVDTMLNSTIAPVEANVTFTDITTNNASTSKHGYQAKGTASTSTFYRSDNTQAAVTDANLSVSDVTTNNASTSAHGFQAKGTGSTTTFYRSDNTQATPPVATATVAGYVPTPPNNTTTFLRGDATFTQVGPSGISSGTSTQILLNNATPTPTWTTVSGDGTLSSTGVLTVSPTRNELLITGGSGEGSTNNVIRRFTSIISNTGTAFTVTQSATNGDSFTINETGIYCITYTDSDATGSFIIGLSVNSNQLTTSILSITSSNVLAISANIATGVPNTISITLKLTATDVVRAHGNTAARPAETSNQAVRLRIVKITQ